jgi:hypothetical protein
MPDSVVSREKDPHPGVLLAVSALLIAAAVGLLLMVEKHSDAGAVINSPASFDVPREVRKSIAPRQPREATEPRQPGVLTKLSTILDAADRSSFRAETVAVRDVPVQSVVGDYTFWIGTSSERRIPVVLLGERTARQAENQTEVRVGQRVNVFGMVRLLKDVQRIDESWALNERDREELRRQPVYISAEQVEIVRPVQ